eukprot:Hpha_TRINITY_DN17334_c0_g1::TRINITY_DN17334_c0_g1_i1::g.138034::m.138034/K06959/tex; protein Tex
MELERFVGACTRLTGLPELAVHGGVNLLLQGNSIQFIARYRRDAIRGLSEDQMRSLQRVLVTRQKLEERRTKALALLAKKPEAESLVKAVEAADSIEEVNELCSSVVTKASKGSLADRAREAGCERVALALLTDHHASDLAFREAVDAQTQGGATPEAATQAVSAHVSALVAESLSLHPATRSWCRGLLCREGLVTVGAKETKKKGESDKENDKGKGKENDKTKGKTGQTKGAQKPDSGAQTYAQYFDFNAPVSRLANHQVLAISRGEREGHLKVTIDPPGRASDVTGPYGLVNFALSITDRPFAGLSRVHHDVNGHGGKALLEGVKKAWKRHLLPTATGAVRKMLQSRALEASALAFARNLRPLLEQRPLRDAVVLALDPGYFHGTKCAVLSATGCVLDTFVIHPLPPQQLIEAAAERVRMAVVTHGVTHCAVGSGHGGRPCEKWLISTLRQMGCEHVASALVSESGASIYSVSLSAVGELPDLDCTLRGAVYIGRALQDPLSERCKVDPEHLGVGMYQHDSRQKDLAAEVHEAVCSIVSASGCDLNTAGLQVLRRVAGLNLATARAIVARRSALPGGLFQSRSELQKVKGLGPKMFQQCA